MAPQSGVDPRLSQAKKLVRAREPERALPIYEELAAERPDDADVQEAWAFACFALGQYQDAAEHFEHAVRLKPREAKLKVNLGAVYNRLGEYQRAVDTLRRALQVDRTSAEAYYNLGIAYRGLKQAAMAVSAYREAIRLAPEMADAHQNLANALMDLSNPRQAIAHYNQALQLRPSFDRAQRGLERAEQALDDSRQSISPFGRLVGAQPAPGQKQQEREQPPGRTLSGEERVRDRHELKELATFLAARAKALREAARDTLEPAIVDLNKTVAKGQSAVHLLPEKQEAFEAAVGSTDAARRELAHVVRRLQVHEEQIAQGPSTG